MTLKLLWMVAAASVCLALQGDDDAKALPDGPEKDLVVKACIDCHGAANFRKLRLNADEWSDKVGDMVERGAKADDKSQAAIIAYLARNFGKDSKVLVNSAPPVELIAVLGFSSGESDATVSYRTDYGPFKGWQDLLKVPGIDAKKVESKKDKMAF